MKEQKLIDTKTQFHIQGIQTTDTSPQTSICPKSSDDPYFTLLSEFPTLLCVSSPDTPILHNVQHHIETTGPPVSARPRRLAPERFSIAKQEYEHMMQLAAFKK